MVSEHAASGTVSRVGRFRHDASWAGDPPQEIFRADTIVITTRGRWRIRRNGSSVDVDPAVVVLARGGEMFRCSHFEEAPSDEQVFVVLSEAGMVSLLEGYPDAGGRRLAREPLPAIGQVRQTARMLAIVASLASARAPSTLGVDALTLELLLEVNAAACEPGVASERGSLRRSTVKQVLQYLEEHYAQEISLAALARTAHVSPFHLHRLVRELTGKTPHRHLVEIRLRRARELLVATDLPSSDIARAVGFNSPSHFSRVFKTHVGMTPIAYRRAA